MLQYLYLKAYNAKWFQEFPDDDGKLPEESSLGLAWRKPDGTYITEPRLDPLLLQVFFELRAGAALTMSSQYTEAFLSQLHPDDTTMTLGGTLVVPIFQSLNALVEDVDRVKNGATVCFLKDERIAIIWHETGEGLLALGTLIEERVMESVSIACQA